MGIAPRRADFREPEFVNRVRTRLIQITAAGALAGCLYGGIALAPAVASFATAHVAPASQMVASTSTSEGTCGAVPFNC